MASTAKDALQQFLLATRTKAQFEFDFPGTELAAARHVQNMRVFLSRLRKRYRAAGKAIKDFKILTISMAPIVKDGKKLTHVILEKSTGDGAIDGLLDGFDEIIDDGVTANG